VLPTIPLLYAYLVLIFLFSVVSSIILGLVVFGTGLDMALNTVNSFGIYNSNYSTELSTHSTETVNENGSVRGSDDVTMFRIVANAKSKLYYNIYLP